MNRPFSTREKVLLVVLVVFSWYLFGGKFMEKIQEDRANDVENVDPAPVDPTNAIFCPGLAYRLMSFRTVLFGS